MNSPTPISPSVPRRTSLRCLAEIYPEELHQGSRDVARFFEMDDPIFKNKFDLLYGQFPNPLNYTVVVRAFLFFQSKSISYGLNACFTHFTVESVCLFPGKTLTQGRHSQFETWF